MIVLAVLLTVGCKESGLDEVFQPPPSQPACDAGGGVVAVTVDQGPPTEPLTSDLFLTGTVESPGHTVIRRVSVAGARANRDAYNFESWSVVVPLARLRGMAGPQGDVTLFAVAEDGCGQLWQSDTLSAQMESGEVSDLQLTVTTPGNAGFIPPDGTTAALVEVRAAQSSAGGVVRLTTSVGALGGTSGAIELTLQRTESAATASTILTSREPGAASVVASSGGERANAELIVARGPVFGVTALTLTPGTEQLVPVTAEVEVGTCEAGRATSIRVTLDGEDIASAARTVAGNRASLRIEGLATTAEETTVVRCRDRYFQSATLTVTNRP